MNPYWICGHLNLLKIRHESLLNFVHIFRMNPYWICKHLTLVKTAHESLLGKWKFSRMNTYWICGHLKLVKIGHQPLLNFEDKFPHESLLNLWASKASQNSTWILTENCRQFFRMNPYWICGHVKLVKIWHESLLKIVNNFSAWFLSEFMNS